MELWLVRHGETADNHLKILAGHLPGKLSQLGISQAVKTGKRLAKENWTEIYCSDLGRAKETLENILLPCSDKYVNKIHYTELLREKGAGVLQGQALGIWKTNAAKAGQSIRQYRAEKGESWEDVYVRADKFIENLIDKYVRGKKENKSFEKEEEKIKEISLKIKSEKFEESKIEMGIQGQSFWKIDKKIQPNTLVSINKNKNKDEYPKILVVTHGGFIMEFFNSLNYRKSKQKPIFLNNTKNCSLNIIRIYGKDEKAKGGNEIVYEVIKRNDTTHVEERESIHK